MSITTITSRELNHDIGKAKRAALAGPVVITDRGKPAHVLLSIDDYHKISGHHTSIVDLLAMPEAADIEFEAPRTSSEIFRPTDFS